MYNLTRANGGNESYFFSLRNDEILVLSIVVLEVHRDGTTVQYGVLNARVSLLKYISELDKMKWCLEIFSRSLRIRGSRGKVENPEVTGWRLPHSGG